MRGILREIDQQLLEESAGRDAGALRKLLAQGADARIKNDDGGTPLMVACVNGEISLIDILAPASNIEDADVDGWTALSYAVASGSEATAGKLVGLGARSGCFSGGKSMLMLASERGQVEMARLLLPISNIHAVDEWGWTAKMHALHRKKEACVALLEQWEMNLDSACLGGEKQAMAQKKRI